MIETIFYFQIFVYLAFLGFAIWHRSPAFFLFAGVLSLMTAVQISGEGISYPTGWTGRIEGNIDDLNLTIDQSYTVENIATSDSLNFWYYGLLAAGFVWLIAAYALSADVALLEFFRTRFGRR